MKLDDFLDPERGPEALVRLAACALVIVVVGGLVATILSQLRATDLLLAMLFLAIMSPVAYAVRKKRLGHDDHPRARRGAERTPLVPPMEDDEE